MNKEEIYSLLNKSNIEYKIINHQAIYNMKDAYNLTSIPPEYEAKNIFLCDNKNNYYLITIKGDKKIDLKLFKKQNNLKNIRLATSEELLKELNLLPGHVTPLGLLNNKKQNINYYLDKYFIEKKYIAIHPNDNKATIIIKTKDLINILVNYNYQTKILYEEV